MAYKQQIFIYPSSGGWKSKIKVPADLVSGEGFIDGRFLPVSSLGRRGQELSGVFFMRALIPFMRAPLSGLNHLPKAPPPNTITLRI